MVCSRYWNVKNREDGIALVLSNDAVVTFDDTGGEAEIAIQDRDQLGRLQTFRQGSEAYEIDEEDRAA